MLKMGAVLKVLKTDSSSWTIKLTREVLDRSDVAHRKVALAARSVTDSGF
ncbi:MAG: hypothetical protein ABWZ76_10050 [Acidimicrobiales bacterium]